MSTPTLNAGENPRADAAAAVHVKCLLSTGMAYEFQPETIATRAFLDGWAAGGARVVDLEVEIERWRTATAKLRDAAAESARAANGDLARMEECLRNSGRNMEQAQEQIAERDAKIVGMSAELARVTAERDEIKNRNEFLVRECESADLHKRELLRLANRTGGDFLLFESVATAVKHGDGELSAYVVEAIAT